MKRVAYFGTQGGGVAGHYFTAIVGQFSREEEREVIRLDSDKTTAIFEGKRQFKFFDYGKYKCLALNASPDDKRGGSITIALVENATEYKEVLDAIETSNFMRNQFDRLVKITGIPMPQV
ncbi:hypothetical protein [Bacteroides sp. 224]|uniref:hypothetical protein n=1 Tax=Bacteroides sp. 224 TaxID=2302936 RepID=UPI0013D71A82|nr:hypothetical protein [Bacteroides sp. 224]NDV63896.1 hypothetical protein [Bacteroides sp. 224]